MLGSIIDLLVKNARWTAPALVLVTSLIVTIACTSSRRPEQPRWLWLPEWMRRRLFRQPQAAIRLTPFQMVPFSTEPAMHDVKTAIGPVKVIHAALADGCPAGEVNALNLAMHALFEAARATEATRFLIDVPRFGPSARYFFQCLRALGQNAAVSGGTLVVRYEPEPLGYSWFSGSVSLWYHALPATRPLEECFAFAASAPILDSPEPDDDH